MLLIIMLREILHNLKDTFPDIKMVENLLNSAKIATYHTFNSF